MISVETDIGGQWGEEIGWRSLVEAAARAAVRASRYRALIESGIVAELSVKMTGNSFVQALNAEYRNKDRPTNVLSFPMIEAEALKAISTAAGGEILLGDVVLAYETCTAEAAERMISVNAHAAHLVVHGVLHLLGYDHDEGTVQAEAMEQAERDALAQIGIADPYAITEVQT